MVLGIAAMICAICVAGSSCIFMHVHYKRNSKEVHVDGTNLDISCDCAVPFRSERSPTPLWEPHTSVSVLVGALGPSDTTVSVLPPSSVSGRKKKQGRQAM